ncbi:MAG: hypothetical protein IID31_10530 [Planctomycetes bacterium]|nr:hypothetical protein [Planctomycetota bacterium]
MTRSADRWRLGGSWLAWSKLFEVMLGPIRVHTVAEPSVPSKLGPLPIMLCVRRIDEREPFARAYGVVWR